MTTRLVALLLAFGPGGLLGFALPRGRYRWAVWASAPILSLGLTAVGVAWLPALHLPDGPTAVLVLELLLTAPIVAISRLVQWPSGRAVGDRRHVPAWRDLVACGVPVLVSLAFGRLILGRFRWPTGWDAMNHVTFVRNIMETGSTAMTSACSTGPSVRSVACRFYPIAADVSWAQAANLSGGRISVAMTTWSMIIGPTALVLGLYAVVRVMGGGRVVAACAAGLPAVLGPLWAQQMFGRVTGAFPVFGVTIALLLALAVRERYAVRLGALAGLASAGLALTHTYDVLFAASFAVAMLVTLSGRIRVRSAAWAIGAAAAATVVAVAPLANALRTAGGERTTRTPLFPHHLLDSVEYWVTDLRRYVLFGNPVPGSTLPMSKGLVIHVAVWVTVACLVASPLCFVFARLRWGRPWLLTWAFWTVLGIWTTTSTSGPAGSLAALWYGSPERLRDMVFPIYVVPAVAGACAIGICLHNVVSRLSVNQNKVAALPSAMALLLVVPLVAIGARPSARSGLESRLGRLTMTSSAYPRVFSWLDRHTPRGEVVAYNRNVEFLPWMLDDSDIGELFGIFSIDPVSHQDQRDRFESYSFLVGQPGQPPNAACLVNKYRIRYVVVGTHKISGSYVGPYRHDDIVTSPYLTLVHTDGPLRVFEVNDQGRACPT